MAGSRCLLDRTKPRRLPRRQYNAISPPGDPKFRETARSLTSFVQKIYKCCPDVRLTFQEIPFSQSFGMLAQGLPPDRLRRRCGPFGAFAVDDEFIELISLTDRIRRRCLDLVRDELEQLAVRNINPTQALMLLKIGHMTMSPTELIERGDYPGTNPSYNVKRLVECGLVTRERRTRDRRSNAVLLTDKGHHLRRLLLALHRRHSELAADGPHLVAEVASAADMLRQLERSLETIGGGGGQRRRVQTGPAPRRRRREG